jgi:inositol-pentakisphosphate 2-kinase
VSSPSDVERAIVQILPFDTPATVSRFKEWIANTDILQKLRTYQHSMDVHGALDAKDEEIGHDLLVAMTLRDCTVYVKFQPSGKVDARIGDLDVKSRKKVPYWRSVESNLIQEGWYAGTEVTEGGTQVNCHLNPGRRIEE